MHWSGDEHQPDRLFRDTNDWRGTICQTREGGSIDRKSVRDVDGLLYLYWKNDGNCCMMATYIYVQALSADATELIGDPVRLVRNDELWEGRVIEVPTLWRHDDQYYLFLFGQRLLGRGLRRRLCRV